MKLWPRNGDIDNRSQTCYSSEFPPRIYSQATGVKSPLSMVCNKPRLHFLDFTLGNPRAATPENTTLSKVSKVGVKCKTHTVRASALCAMKLSFDLFTTFQPGGRDPVQLQVASRRGT